MQSGLAQQRIGCLPLNSSIGTGTEFALMTAFAGGGQTNATQIVDMCVEVATVATAADSMKLPIAVAGKTVYIVSSASNYFQLYGNGIDTINDIATGTGISVGGGTRTGFFCTKSASPGSSTTAATGGEWYAFGDGVGAIGAVTTATLATGSAVALTSPNAANVTSVTGLTPGTYDVSGTIDYKAGGATTFTVLKSGVNTTSATIGAQDTFTNLAIAGTLAAASDLAVTTQVVRVTITATTQTIYLVAQATFAVSTLAAYGTIRATRIF